MAQEKFPGLPNFKPSAVWKSFIPSKICFFLWSLWNKKILTVDVLKKRGMVLPNRCVMRCQEEEDATHLFVKCRYIQKVWNTIRRGAPRIGSLEGDLIAIINNRPTETPIDFNGWLASGILHATYWLIWNQRNQRIFRDHKAEASIIARHAIKSVISWVSAHDKIDKCSAAICLNNCLSRL
ncbi:unnamed protein product [Linum trigynum]|uniref:Reverse transcriptase zinc-binding domain-containing protein n=1 Tax=Linum trigynum TaxID=586398 RepID=A0AAV2CNW1_9ROSI